MQQETAETLGTGMCQRIVAENAVDQALWERWGGRGWKAEGRDPAAPPPPLPGSDRLRSLGSDIATFCARQVLRWTRSHRMENTHPS